FAFARQQAGRVQEDPRIEVRLNTELTSEMAESENADILLCAVGSLPVVPPVPGLKESPRVVGLEALHTSVPRVGQKVVILGGGLIGSESAIYLDSLGKDVTIVEQKDTLAPDAPYMHKYGMDLYFEKSRIQIHRNTRAKAVLEEGLLCEDDRGREVLLEADTILLAAGMRPNQEAVEELRYAAPRFFQIGDCVKVGKVYDAVHGGYYGALDI
ncbi:MAG: FAD-dependent oxidoreductase, partial [Candidatus Heritagella sp.]